MLISWFHYAKNNENTQIPRKKSIINSYIKGKVVIKLWKINMKSQKSLWQPNMQVFSLKDSEGFSLLKKKKDENMFISLPKIRMTNGWHGKERQKHHLTIPIHGKFSLVLQWISHTLYILRIMLRKKIQRWPGGCIPLGGLGNLLLSRHFLPEKGLWIIYSGDDN